MAARPLRKRHPGTLRPTRQWPPAATQLRWQPDARDSARPRPR